MLAFRVALHGQHPDRRPVDLQGHPQPAHAGRALAHQLPPVGQLGQAFLVGQQRPAGAQHIRGDPSAQGDPVPRGRFVLLVHEVQEPQTAGIRLGDEQVVGGHQRADDAVDAGIQLLQIGHFGGGLGDGVYRLLRGAGEVAPAHVPHAAQGPDHCAGVVAQEHPVVLQLRVAAVLAPEAVLQLEGGAPLAGLPDGSQGPLAVRGVDALAPFRETHLPELPQAETGDLLHGPGPLDPAAGDIRVVHHLPCLGGDDLVAVPAFLQLPDGASGGGQLAQDQDRATRRGQGASRRLHPQGAAAGGAQLADAAPPRLLAQPARAHRPAPRGEQLAQRLAQHLLRRPARQGLGRRVPQADAVFGVGQQRRVRKAGQKVGHGLDGHGYHSSAYCRIREMPLR